ncbi:MAG: UDP-N-acetylmuramate dehydrogenase [Candidatus Omnitrophota bacterium]
MVSEHIKTKIKGICGKHGGNVLFDHSLLKYSTIGIGGRADVLYFPFSPEELRETMSYLREQNVSTTVMGRGSNMLIPDSGLRGVVVNFNVPFFRKISIEGTNVTAGAGVFLGKLIAECFGYGLAGIEGLIGIPGTVGGALKINASYQTAVSDRLLRLMIINGDNEIQWLEKKDIEFGYRYSSLEENDIILQAVFFLDKDAPDRIRKKMKSFLTEKLNKQPMDKRTLGCIFKNPVDSNYTSAQMLDKCGLKGFEIGGARISRKHANFIINTGKAGSGDVVDLMEKMRQQVFEKFSVELEPEIQILDSE